MPIRAIARGDGHQSEPGAGGAEVMGRCGLGGDRRSMVERVEPQIRKLLKAYPKMPAMMIADRPGRLDPVGPGLSAPGDA